MQFDTPHRLNFGCVGGKPKCDGDADADTMYKLLRMKQKHWALSTLHRICSTKQSYGTISHAVQRQLKTEIFFKI